MPNRIPFVSNYIYELFGAKWTHPREPVSVPQMPHRRGHVSFIQFDAAELHPVRGFSPAFAVSLNPAF